MIHNDFAAGFRAKKNEIKRLNKRIAELEADVRKSNIIHTAQNGAIDRLNARIAELEKDNDELELDTLKRMRVVSELEEELMNTKESLNLWYTRGVNDGKEQGE